MSRMRLFGLLLLAALTGCTTTAPVYNVSVPNIQKLRDSGSSKIAITNFELDPAKADSLNRIGIRGGSMVSPNNGSYATYLRDALGAEFLEAGRLAETSPVALSGVLTANDAGFSVGTATVGAKFVVRRNNQVAFDKTLSSTHQWESSFVGAVAIPAAINNYPTAIQKLLDALYSDKSFQEAIK